MGIHQVKADIRRAVFLDRDGVINRALEKESKPYPPTSLAEFEILPEVPAGGKCNWQCALPREIFSPRPLGHRAAGNPPAT